MSTFLRLYAVCMLVGLIASNVSAQHLYLSNTPNLCAAIGSNAPIHYYIYAHCPDDASFDQATFRLETNAFSASDVEFVSPMPGVIVLSGEIFNGITVQWSPRALEHTPLLEINLIDTAPAWGEVWITDATMARPGGSVVPIEDKLSYLSTDFHCSMCLFRVNAPDTVDVVVGGVTTIRIFLAAGCDGAVAASFDVSDTEAWIDSWTPTGLYLPDYCGACVWNWKPVDIDVAVPSGTPAGTHSEVTVADTATFMARAVAPVPVKKTTWGRIKALHADTE